MGEVVRHELEPMELNKLSSKIIKAAINVHQELGPGLLESVYQTCMLIELKKAGLEVRSEVPLPIVYQGQKVSDEGFRIDILVEDLIVVELKSVEKVQPVHQKQLLPYLRLAKKQLGLLINFNEVLLKNGITRVINAPKGLGEKTTSSEFSAGSV
jgi:GxxExxY protein